MYKQEEAKDRKLLLTSLGIGLTTVNARLVVYLDLRPIGDLGLAPLSRSRANKDHVHTDLGVECYAQCSPVPGSLQDFGFRPWRPCEGAHQRAYPLP